MNQKKACSREFDTLLPPQAHVDVNSHIWISKAAMMTLFASKSLAHFES